MKVWLSWRFELQPLVHAGNNWPWVYSIFRRLPCKNWGQTSSGTKPTRLKSDWTCLGWIKQSLTRGWLLLCGIKEPLDSSKLSPEKGSVLLGDWTIISKALTFFLLQLHDSACRAISRKACDYFFLYIVIYSPPLTEIWYWNSGAEVEAQIMSRWAVCETEIAWHWLWGKHPALWIGSSLLENRYKLFRAVIA